MKTQTFRRSGSSRNVGPDTTAMLTAIEHWQEKESTDSGRAVRVDSIELRWVGNELVAAVRYFLEPALGGLKLRPLKSAREHTLPV